MNILDLMLEAERADDTMKWCEHDRIVGIPPAGRVYFGCEHKFVTNIVHGRRCFYCGTKENHV